MTSKNSSNKSKTGSLKQYHWLFLMSFVVIAFCTTIPAMMQALEQFHAGRRYNVSNLFIENIALSTLSTAIAFTTGISLFKYLNNKPEVDFFHSLPIKSEDIFVSRFVLGLVVYLIPLLLNFALTYAVSTFADFRFIPTIDELFYQCFQSIANYFSVFSFVCLGVVVTGNNFMATCSAIGFAFAPTAFVFVWYGLSQAFLDFFPPEPQEIATVAKYTNPLASSVLGAYVGATAWNFLAQGIVISALTFYCYHKRPSENAANPVALNPFKLIIKSLGVVCGSSLGGMVFLTTLSKNPVNFLAGAFIMAVILHVAFEMLFEMDIRAGFRNIRHFVVLYGMVALFAILISFDLTNYDQKIVPVTQISSFQQDGLTFESEENIEILHDFMERSIQNDIEGDINYYGTLTVTQTNGRSYRRTYHNTLAKEDHLSLITSLEYVLQTHNYDLDAADLDRLEREVEMANITYEDRSYFFPLAVEYYNERLSISMETFRQIHALVTENLDLLTPEYLAENAPTLTIVFTDENYQTTRFPLYNIHQEAMALLDIPDFNVPDWSKLNLTIDIGDTSTTFNSFSNEFQEAFLAEMTPILDHTSGQPYGYLGQQHNKELVALCEYYMYGYVSIERYEALLEEYN